MQRSQRRAKEIQRPPQARRANRTCSLLHDDKHEGAESCGAHPRLCAYAEKAARGCKEATNARTWLSRTHTWNVVSVWVFRAGRSESVNRVFGHERCVVSRGASTAQSAILHCESSESALHNGVRCRIGSLWGVHAAALPRGARCLRRARVPASSRALCVRRERNVFTLGCTTGLGCARLARRAAPAFRCCDLILDSLRTTALGVCVAPCCSAVCNGR